MIDAPKGKPQVPGFGKALERLMEERMLNDKKALLERLLREKRASLVKQLEKFCQESELVVDGKKLSDCAVIMLENHLYNTRAPEEIAEDELRAEAAYWATAY